MRFKYKVMMKVKTGTLFPKVKDLEDTLNGFMKDCGFYEEIFLQSEFPVFELSSDRILKDEEKFVIMKSVDDHFKETKYELECTEMVLIDNISEKS